MLGRRREPEDDEDGRSARAARGGAGSVPFGAFILLVSMAVVFLYGIHLKRSSPQRSTVAMKSPLARASGGETAPARPFVPPSRIDGRDDEAALASAGTAGSGAHEPDLERLSDSHEDPVIPESRSAASSSSPGPGGSSGDRLRDGARNEGLPAPTSKAPTATKSPTATQRPAGSTTIARPTDLRRAAATPPEGAKTYRPGVGGEVGLARKGSSPAPASAAGGATAARRERDTAPLPAAPRSADPSSGRAAPLSTAPRSANTPARRATRTNPAARRSSTPPPLPQAADAPGRAAPSGTPAVLPPDIGASPAPPADAGDSAGSPPATPLRAKASSSIDSRGSPRSAPSQAPRGSAPAVAVKRARDLFTVGRYDDAAGAWKDWARGVPGESWTVQIAAVRLERAAGDGTLASVAARDGVFVLPPGSGSGDLSPVCVGIYPSEEAARRASAAVSPFPGSASKPIVKRVGSLLAGN